MYNYAIVLITRLHPRNKPNLHTLASPPIRLGVIPSGEQYNCRGLPIFSIVDFGSGMLENINLNKKLARDEYKSVLPDLQTRLYDLEKACWDNGVPTIVI